jgi:hypothetical protein
MGTCTNHPDRETPYICTKHQVHLCEECLNCRDPQIYCKHRSACPIWFLEKRQKRKRAALDLSKATPTSSKADLKRSF